MNIFLDVGGFNGETLREVLKPIYRFDMVHCFEPQAECYATLQATFHDRSGDKLVLHNVGLADFDGEQDLYGKGVGASMFSDKRDIDNCLSQKCQFVSASRFFDEHINQDDFVVMKLNCEGGELLILRDLMRSGKIHSLENVMIDFDIRKIPSKQHEQKNIMAELKAVGFTNYSLRKKSMLGTTHHESIHWWLSNLKKSSQFVDLTEAEKRIRILPFSVRLFIQKNKRKLQRKIKKLLKNKS